MIIANLLLTIAAKIPATNIGMIRIGTNGLANIHNPREFLPSRNDANGLISIAAIIIFLLTLVSFKSRSKMSTGIIME